MGKRSSKGKTIGATPGVIKKLIVLLLTIFTMDVIFANPEGGVVTSGNATITQSPGSTQIHQTSDKAIIEWRSFNIGANEKTQFNQPSSSSVTLNRIDPSQGVSQIFGQLSANGQIILVNQAGIYFGPTARVDIGSIIASTRGITDQNFLAGKYIFDQVSNHNGTVINQGTIIAAQHGLVALIGANVSNEGYIQANKGHVVLASGNKFTIDLAGDGLLHFSVDESSSQSGADQNGNAMRDGVKNTGTIIADGGKILITAKAAKGIVDNVINMQGVAIARSVSTDEKGEIILSSEAEGNVVVAGNLNASGKTAGLSGGTVKILGNYIKLNSPTQIDVSGDLSGGEILIGGNYKGQGPERNALTTTVDAGVTLNANALTTGNGGKIIVWSDGATRFAGNATAQGGAVSGDGGLVETSGHYLNVSGAYVSTLAPFGNTGTWLLDPTNIYIASDQANATAAGMSGTDTSADTGSGGEGSPTTFQASGAVNDSLLTTSSLMTALDSNNVLVTTNNDSGGGAGNIIVVDPITWTSFFSLSLVADNNIVINAAITGTNGLLNLTAADAAQSITTGSSGTVNVSNFNLLQGRWYQVGTLPSFSVSNNFQIVSGAATPTGVEFLRASSGNGSTSPYVIEDIYGLQGINSSSTLRASNFNLGQNIDASATSNWIWHYGTGFTPIGSGDFGTHPDAFTGNFNGQSFTIDSIFMDATTNSQGIFGFINGASISNVGVTNVTVKSGTDSVGALVGFNFGGTISNSYSTGTVGSGSDSGIAYGGLVGSNNGTISNSYSTATVTTNGSYVGGLVGINGNNGNGSISTSYSTGAVTSGGSSVGGLVGAMNNNSSIANSYSQSNVIAIGGQVGGLVGNVAVTESTVSNSYSTGTVNGGSDLGGLIGINGGTGNITNSFWDATNFGLDNGAGGTGLTTDQMKTASNFTGAGWDFSTTPIWGLLTTDVTAQGQSYPYLNALHQGIIIPTNFAEEVIEIASNGSVIIPVIFAASNTTIYYILLNRTGLSTTSPIIVYNTGGTHNFNAIVTPGTGAASNAITFPTISTNTAQLGASTNVFYPSTNYSSSITNTLLAQALGGLSSISLYSASGVNLTFSSNLIAASSLSFSIDGDITTSGAQTYQNAVSIGASGVDLSITGTGDLIFSGNISGNSFTASSSSAANTFAIQNNNSQTWNLSGSNGGTVSGIGGSGATFSGFGNLTGGSGSNIFNIANGATATLLTGGSGTSNTLQYSYSSPLTLTMSSQYAGSVASDETINSYSNFDTVSGVTTLTTANKTNNVYITGGGSGYIDDPFNFSGVSFIVGQGTTNIIFNTSATYTSTPSEGSATVNVGGTSMSFSNISSFSGNVSTATTTTPTVDQPIVNALVSQITLGGYTSITTQSEPQSQSTSGSSYTSINSNSDSEQSDSTTTNSNQVISPVITVSNNTAEINQNQQQADIAQQESQSFSQILDQNKATPQPLILIK